MIKRNHKKIILMIIVLSLLILSGCVPGNGSYNHSKPANLLSGIWHGWIAPFTLMWSIFDRSVRIYETINTGFGYDFGFYIAIISGFGGLSLTRKKKSD